MHISVHTDICMCTLCTYITYFAVVMCVSANMQNTYVIYIRQVYINRIHIWCVLDIDLSVSNTLSIAYVDILSIRYIVSYLIYIIYYVLCII